MSKIIVGLGNPGREYMNTRHNAGFMVVDHLIDTENLSEKKSQKCFSMIADLKVGRNKIILAKPQTFMNESGKAVVALLNFYKTTITDLVVVHDDKDIPLGEIKVQTDRGSAGHNGIKSIIEQLGTQNFTRIRVGIAPTDKKIAVISDYVLRNFSDDEKNLLNDTLKNVVEIIKNQFGKS